MTAKVALPVVCDVCGGCCLEQGLPPGYTNAVMMAHLPADLRNEILGHLGETKRTGVSRYGTPCLWLDPETMFCRHYELRPGTCRAFSAGTSGCNTWREKLGLPPFVVEHPEPQSWTPEPDDAADTTAEAPRADADVESGTEGEATLSGASE